MTEKDFRAEIKTGKLRNAYFFYGEEEYLKRIARRTLRNYIIEDESFASFNLIKFFSRETSVLREFFYVFFNIF